MEEYLSHHGVLGQKWGVQHGPPYPLSPSVSTGSSLKSGGKKRVSLGDEIRAKKKAKQKSKQLESARAQKAKLAEERKAAEEHAAKREEVIKKGTPQEVQKYKGELSADEYREILQRFKDEESLRDYVRKTTPPPQKNKVEVLAEKVDHAADVTEKYIKGYNTLARLSKAFTSVELPVIPERKELWEHQKDKDPTKVKQEAAKRKADKEKQANDLEIAKQRRKAAEAEAKKKPNQGNTTNNINITDSSKKPDSNKSVDDKKSDPKPNKDLLGLPDKSKDKTLKEKPSREKTQSSNTEKAKTVYEKAKGEVVSEEEYWDSFQSQKAYKDVKDKPVSEYNPEIFAILQSQNRLRLPG